MSCLSLNAPYSFISCLHCNIIEDYIYQQSLIYIRGFWKMVFQDGCAVPVVHFASPVPAYVQGESNLCFAVMAFSSKYTLYYV